MGKWMGILVFVAAAAFSWGVYVPIVHRAAIEFGSNLRAFMLVGVAYFLVAVLAPAVFVFVLNSDPTTKQGAVPNFRLASCLWGIAAGTAGALGALCVIFAVTRAGPGAAIYVAPLVFAGAPIVNTLATMLFFHPTRTLPDSRFFFGLILAATGAVMVMVYKPEDKPRSPARVATSAEPQAGKERV